MHQERQTKSSDGAPGRVMQDALNVDIKRILGTEGARQVTRKELIDDTGKSRAEARTDGLTGLYNKREFEKRLLSEIASAWRRHTPLSVLMLDGDKFKNVNDTHGHPIGDETLKRLVYVMRQSVRTSDVVCRIGGEEFAIILPDTALDGAMAAAEKIRSAVERTPFVFGEHDVDSTQPGGKFTISIGATSYPPRESVYETQTHSKDEMRAYHVEIADSLAKTADAALYDAKRTRNTVSVRIFGNAEK